MARGQPVVARHQPAYQAYGRGGKRLCRPSMAKKGGSVARAWHTMRSSFTSVFPCGWLKKSL